MRVLFTTTPGWGHLHPMVPLAKAFVDRGDDVQWAAAAELVPKLQRYGFPVVAAGLGLVESQTEFLRLFPEYEALAPAERSAFTFPRLFGSVRAAPMLADILAFAREWSPSLIVHEQGEFAAPIAAALLDVPHITHGFGSLRPAGMIAAAGDAVAGLWDEHGLAPPAFGGSYDHLYLDIYPPSLRVERAAHVPAIQPLRPLSLVGDLDEPVPAWVRTDNSAPLVYVTFGTVFNTDVPLVSEVVDGVRDLPVRVVVTVGPAGDPGLLGDQPGKVHVTRYLPQNELMPHCAAVVSHGGSGTFLAALSHGLPQLCLPQAADQFYNAATCVNSGVGLALQPGTVSAGTVRAAVEKLLSDAHFGEAADRLRREIETMPSPDDVAELIGARWA
jgi:UDP:flavonoid glycosyltransferase YjiC (YdhE family)